MSLWDYTYALKALQDIYFYDVVHLLSFLHGLSIAFDLRKNDRLHLIPWPSSMLAFFVKCIGGTTLAALLLGQPPAWLVSNVIFPTYLLAWIAIFAVPGEFIFHFIDSTVIGEPLLAIPQGISTAVTIADLGVDGVRKLAMHEKVRDSIVAAILCGVLSGSGGGILAQALHLAQGWDAQFRADGSVNVHRRGSGSSMFGINNAIFNALVTAVVYFAATDSRVYTRLPSEFKDPWGWRRTSLLDADAAKLLCSLYLASATLASKLYITTSGGGQPPRPPHKND